MDNVKDAKKSRTLWFNMLVGGLSSLEPIFPVLKPLLGDFYYPILITILVVGNSLLRVITTQGVSFVRKN